MRDERFRAQMAYISRSLKQDDVDKIKFLLKDSLPQSDLVGAKQGFQLIELLQKCNLVGEENLVMLVHLLVAINHRMLARILNGGVAIADDDSLERLPPWRVAMIKCSEDVGDDSLNSIKFLLQGDDDFGGRLLERCSSLLDLVAILEECGADKENITAQVNDWMHLLGRRNFNFTSLLPRTGCGREGSNGAKACGSPLRKRLRIFTSTSPPGVPSPPPGFVPRPRSQPIQFVETSIPYALKDAYDPCGNGLCVIINNKTFFKDELYNEDAKSLQERTGTEKDEMKLMETFGGLGYDLYVRHDLTAAEIREEVTRIIGEFNLRKYGALIFIVLSHGCESAVYGSDGMPVRIDEIKHPFGTSSCPSMAGKPKVFLIQACQGEKAEEFHIVQSDGGGGKTSMKSREKKTHVVGHENPNFADFFLGYATIQGFKSYRHPPTGTWFINALCNNIRQYAFNDAKHFNDIFVRVNSEVSQQIGQKGEGAKIVKQTPLLESTLRKDFYLRRIVKPS